MPCVRLLNTNDGWGAKWRFAQHSFGLAPRGWPLAGWEGRKRLRIEVVAGLVLVPGKQVRGEQASRGRGVVGRGAWRGIWIVDG